MAYGLKIKNASGHELLITPDILTIHAGGRQAMPASGTSGNTYQSTVALANTYAEVNVGVLVDSFIVNVDLTLHNLNNNGWYAQSWFMNNASSLFTRNESTGVITTWTPNKTAATSYDGLLSVFPIAFWDKRGGSTFSTINIFAGTTYLAYDQSASAYVDVYSLGSQGVEDVDYAVYVRNYQE